MPASGLGVGFLFLCRTEQRRRVHGCACHQIDSGQTDDFLPLARDRDEGKEKAQQPEGEQCR